MDAALQIKLDENKAKKKASFLEEKLIKNMKGTEKEKYKRKLQYQSGKVSSLSKKKSLADEERLFHEAYQLLLSEHYRRVRKRTKQKLKTVTTLMKFSTIEETEDKME